MTQEAPELSTHPETARQKVWSKADLLDVITRSAGATMAVIDRSLSMIYVNDEYARWFGTVPEELVGKTLVEVYGEQDLRPFHALCEPRTQRRAGAVPAHAAHALRL